MTPSTPRLRTPESAGSGVQPRRQEPVLFAGTPGTPRPGLPLVVTGGESDALLLGRELAGLAVVVSLGPDPIRPGPMTLDRLGCYRPWHVAHDADGPGDAAAVMWPASARRVRPPLGKGWADAKAKGVDLRRWWADRLGGVAQPNLFAWANLSEWRWGPGTTDPMPGVVVDHPDRIRLRLAFGSLEDGPGDAHEPEVRSAGRSVLDSLDVPSSE